LQLLSHEDDESQLSDDTEHDLYESEEQALQHDDDELDDDEQL